MQQASSSSKPPAWLLPATPTTRCRAGSQERPCIAQVHRARVPSVYRARLPLHALTYHDTAKMICDVERVSSLLK
eukprot:1495589-Pleurochrysis_carterae.AAC.1